MSNVTVQGKEATDRTNVEEIFATANALHEYVAALLAGEELIGDRFLSIQRTTADWQVFTFDPGGTTVEVLVAGEPCRLGHVALLDGTAPGTITVRDAAATGGGSTGYVFPDIAGLNSAQGMRLEIGYTIETSLDPAGLILALYRVAEFSL